MNKPRINAIFFSFVFLFLMTLSTSLWHHTACTHIFFLCYASVQALLETLGLMLIGMIIERWLPKMFLYLYVGMIFTLLLIHFVNFTLVRLMDVSIAYFFQFFFGYGIYEFFVAFMAMNMNPMMMALIVLAIVATPVIGVFSFRVTSRFWQQKISWRQGLASFCGLAIALIGMDSSLHPDLDPSRQEKYRKIFPVHFSIYNREREAKTKPAIETLAAERTIHALLEESKIECPKKPNIYLFIVEAFRRDCLSEAITPHISRFAARHLAPPNTFASANSTHTSWFAIFHSRSPMEWTDVRDQWTQGSIPLHIFKKLGYQISVYSGADLTYFHMDEMIFGKNRVLADSIQEFSSRRDVEPCDRDRLAISALIDDLDKKRSNTLFITFLDSTHSEYSSPQNFLQPFQPISPAISYLTISPQSNELQEVKNRYLNALYWVDHLIGSVYQKLEDSKLYDDALIAVMGDHGEEFYEEGALFHGTHLNIFQTAVPILYKIPDHHDLSVSPFSTHENVLPTLLHMLTGVMDWRSYFPGKSIFDPARNAIALSVQHNGPRRPERFILHTAGKAEMFIAERRAKGSP